MSIFVSGSERRDIRKDVFRQVFANANDPKLYDAAVFSIVYLQSSASAQLNPIIEAERLVLRFLSKMKGTKLGSIGPNMLYSTGRKLLYAVLNNDTKAVKKIILLNGLFRTKKVTVFDYNVRLPAPLSLNLYANAKAQGLVDDFFVNTSTDDEVEELLQGMAVISRLVYSPEELTEAKRAVQIEAVAEVEQITTEEAAAMITQAEHVMDLFKTGITMAAVPSTPTREAKLPGSMIEEGKAAPMPMLSGYYLGGVDPGAALAVLNTVPVLGDVIGVLGFVKNMFGGKEKQEISALAADEALDKAEEWSYGYKVLLEVPQAETAETIVVNDILNRAQLYSPVDIYGDDMERFIGLPYMGLKYLSILGLESEPTVELETEPFLPDGVDIEEMDDTLDVDPEEVLRDDAQVVLTETNKQWISAAVTGGGILARIFGVF